MQKVLYGLSGLVPNPCQKDIIMIFVLILQMWFLISQFF